MVKHFIEDWFLENGSLKKEDIKSNDNYIESGYIDSFGFLDLIQTCEDRFNIHFSDDDFENDKIFTIDGLAEIIEAKNESV